MYVVLFLSAIYKAMDYMCQASMSVTFINDLTRSMSVNTDLSGYTECPPCGQNSSGLRTLFTSVHGRFSSSFLLKSQTMS